LLIIGVLWRFYAEAKLLLKALHRRIETGSGVKAGPFEITADLHVQAIEEQRKRLVADVREASVGNRAEQIESPKHRRPTQQSALVQTFLLAEDLAVRAVQEEFGANVLRQVRAGFGFELDGMFTLQGAGYGIEVKYVTRRANVEAIRQRVSKAFESSEALGWRRFSLVIALVYAERGLITLAERSRVQEAFAEFGDRVLLRVYSFDDLLAQWGADTLLRETGTDQL
jgi:hypothetical protein